MLPGAFDRGASSGAQLDLGASRHWTIRTPSDVILMFATLVWKVELEAQLREAICAQALRSVRAHEAEPAAACARPRLAVGPVTPRAR